ncbi:Endoglucanase 15, partial [Zea mays]
VPFRHARTEARQHARPRRPGLRGAGAGRRRPATGAGRRLRLRLQGCPQQDHHIPGGAALREAAAQQPRKVARRLRARRRQARQCGSHRRILRRRRQRQVRAPAGVHGDDAGVNDGFVDKRGNSSYTEPCTYINSLAIGPLAALAVRGVQLVATQ